MPALSAIAPRGAVPGARVEIRGAHLPVPADGPPQVYVGTREARVVAASSRLIRVIVPPESEGGPTPVRIDGVPGETLVLDIARAVTTGIHQVDSPVCDAAGRVYVTHSGSRETKASVPLYRVAPDGTREPVPVEIANPTSLAMGPGGVLYVSSRFEGAVYRLSADDRAEVYASDLGVATGLAFAPDGTLFVGDRSGSILRISPERHVDTFASLPSSIAAFHLAYGSDGGLYVTAPTLASHDALYRITSDRLVEVVCTGFGRPQGLAFDASGVLFVVDALAGASGLYRVDVRQSRPVPELIIAAPTLVGVAFDPLGGMLLASADTVWRI